MKQRHRTSRRGTPRRRRSAARPRPPQPDIKRAAKSARQAEAGRLAASAAGAAVTASQRRGVRVARASLFWSPVLGLRATGRWLLHRPRAAALLLVLGCGIAAWLHGLAAFIRDIPMAVSDPASRTDAIVVLTGGKDRVATGLRLLAENRAERVFISGVHPGVDAARLISVTAEARPANPVGNALRSGELRTGEPRGSRLGAELLPRIDIGEQARNTAGNAAESAAWLQHRGYSSLRLVTASYHIPRSLLEFRTALPDARIVPHPVFSQPIEPARWWQEPAMALLLIKEYNKLLIVGLRLRLQSLAGLASS